MGANGDFGGTGGAWSGCRTLRAPGVDLLRHASGVGGTDASFLQIHRSDGIVPPCAARRY